MRQWNSQQAGWCRTSVHTPGAVVTREMPRASHGYRAWMLLLCICIVSGCVSGTRLNYTIPDNYTGFLVIEYACPGGQPAPRHNNEVFLIFNDQGVACIRDRYEDIYPTGISSVASTQTRSGQQVAFVGGGPQERGGYAVVGASVRVVNQVATNERTVFEILWAGEQHDLIQMIAQEEYANVQAEFFEQRLGIPRDGRPRMTPTPEGVAP